MGRLLDEDTVIKVLERWQKAFRENSHYVSASDLSLVVKDVRELPPAKPEPQEGYWIRTGCGLDVECKCSKCGYRDFVEPRDEYWFKRNYCPNCGAKMINK